VTKLSYFNLLDLAEFFMHYLIRISFFDVGTLGVW